MGNYVPDMSTRKSLKLLYNKPDGLRFDELGIDEHTCNTLYENNYIYMPPNSIISGPLGPKRKYDGPITITSSGRAYIESIQRETRRYWITTLIALIALIKSFDKEISAILAWLLKLLTQ